MTGPTRRVDPSGVTSTAARIVLVRHGETVWHAENRYAGSSDIGLTATGQAQAAALGAWAVAVRPDGVVCSPLRRSRVAPSSCRPTCARRSPQ